MTTTSPPFDSPGPIGTPPRLSNSTLRQSSSNITNLNNLNTSPIHGGAGLPGSSSMPALPPRPLTSSMGGYDSPYGTPSRFGLTNSRFAPRYGAGGMYGNSMYGSSMYGNSMYGNSMYGNSMYGSSMYGSGYGGYPGSYGSGGLYGSRFGGYNSYYGGMGRPMGPMMGPDGQPVAHPFSGFLESGFSKMQLFHSFIESFGRLAEIMEMNFSAFHGSFSALFAFVETIGELWQRFHWAIKAFTLYKFIRVLINKVRDYLDQVAGRPPRAKPSLEITNLSDNIESFQSFERQQNQGGWFIPLLVTAVLFIGGPILISNILKKFFAKELDELEEAPEEAAQLNNLPAASPLSSLKFPFQTAALYDYFPQDPRPDDLFFRQGEPITVIREDAPGWFVGSTGGRTGIFPAQWVAQPSSLEQTGSSL